MKHALARALAHRNRCRSRLVVGREATVTPDERGLAGVGKCHVLDGGVSADFSGICRYRQRLEPAALAVTGVGSLHILIDLLKRFLRGGEAVGIFHDELAPAHEAEARTQLVAELILDLIKGHGKLLVALELVAHEVRERLLMGGSKTEGTIVAVFETHKLGAVCTDAARFLPELRWGKNGDKHLLGADGVHLVTADILDLSDRAPCERQIAIKTRSDLANHARAEHELMARKLGLGRILLERGGIEL